MLAIAGQNNSKIDYSKPPNYTYTKQGSET